MTSEKIKDSPPFISIGLPTYNRPEFTRLALKSCLEQNYPHFEIIVSDDSKDRQIQQIVDSFGSDKIRYIRNDPPLGIPAKLNDLLEQARGPWMVLLGDDDLFEPGYLSTVAELIQQHPDAALIHTRCRQIDENGKLLHVDVLQKPSLTPAELLGVIFRPWYEIRVSITGFVFPVQTLKRLGGFRNFYMGYFIDNVAWAMLGAQGTCYFEQTPLATLRENPASLSRHFIPDHGQLIRSREDIVNTVTPLFDGLSAKTSDPAELKKLDLARAQFMECILEDTQNFLDRILMEILKESRASVHAEVQDVLQTARASRLSLFSLRRFHRLMLFYSRISGWPRPLRVAALGIFRLGRHTRIRVMGPKALSEKAHYYRKYPPRL